MIQLKFEPTISTYMFMQHVHVIRYLKIPCKPFTINDEAYFKRCLRLAGNCVCFE